MAGTVVLSSQRSEGAVRKARILATADASDGSFPTKTLRALGIHIDGYLIGISTNPGSTAPTDNYDITLLDEDGEDRLAGAGANRDTSTTEYAAVGRACSPDDTLTLTITGNSVNSATIEIILWWTTGSSVTVSGTAFVSDVTAQGKLDTIITLLGTSTATQVWKVYANTSATLTGQAIWTPASGKKIAVTNLSVVARGTTAGLLTLWFGASGDTTYTSGTDQPVFIGSFAPSATSYPGALLPLSTPILCGNADYILRATTSANLDFDLVVYGYEY